MDASDWITILAVLAAPVFAVQVQKHLEVLRETRQRKKFIFETLMATRMARVSPDHVRALNMISLTFRSTKTLLGISLESRKDKKVQDAWTEYQDHLNTPANPNDTRASREWRTKSDALFVSLLHAISDCLGYNFDRVVLEKGCYSPVAHGTIQQHQETIMVALADVLTGKQPLSIRAAPESKSDSKAVNTLKRAVNGMESGDEAKGKTSENEDTK